MKQLKCIRIATLLLFVFCFAQCHKYVPPPPDNPYGLPNATQDDYYLFACRINGVNCIAKADSYHQMAAINKSNDTLSIGGVFDINYVYMLMFSIYGNLATNYNYDLSDTAHVYAAFSGLGCKNINYNDAIRIQTGNIMFTKIDTANRHISCWYIFLHNTCW